MFWVWQCGTSELGPDSESQHPHSMGPGTDCRTSHLAGARRQVVEEGSSAEDCATHVGDEEEVAGN